MQITVKFYSQNANISSFKELTLSLVTILRKYILFSRSVEKVRNASLEKKVFNIIFKIMQSCKSLQSCNFL